MHHEFPVRGGLGDIDVDEQDEHSALPAAPPRRRLRQGFPTREARQGRNVESLTDVEDDEDDFDTNPDAALPNRFPQMPGVSYAEENEDQLPTGPDPEDRPLPTAEETERMNTEQTYWEGSPGYPMGSRPPPMPEFRPNQGPEMPAGSEPTYGFPMPPHQRATRGWLPAPTPLPYDQISDFSPSVKLTRANLLNYARYARVAAAAKNGMEYPNLFGLMTSSSLTRGQQLFGGDVWKWDSGKFFVNYTFFPAVFHAKDGVIGCAYGVYYSSHPPSEGAIPGNQALLPHKAEWMIYRTVGNDPVDVFVDVKLIGDVNAQAALMTAINTGRPASGSYIAIFPWVMSEEKYSTPDADLIPAGTMGHWPIKGASLGMAILACILGMPSIMYTGYIKSAGPKNLLQLHPNGMILEDIPNAPDILESVDDLDTKCAYAIWSQMPLVIPFKSEFGTPVRKLIADPRFQQRNFLLRQAELAYTMEMAEQGVNFEMARTPIFIAVTITEAACLAAIAAIGFMIDMGVSRQDRTWDAQNREMYSKHRSETVAMKEKRRTEAEKRKNKIDEMKGIENVLAAEIRAAREKGDRVQMEKLKKTLHNIQEKKKMTPLQKQAEKDAKRKLQGYGRKETVKWYHENLRAEPAEVGGFSVKKPAHESRVGQKKPRKPKPKATKKGKSPTLKKHVGRKPAKAKAAQQKRKMPATKVGGRKSSTRQASRVAPRANMHRHRGFAPARASAQFGQGISPIAALRAQVQGIS